MILVLITSLFLLCCALLSFYFLMISYHSKPNFQATEQEYEKEKLNERIAKLSGGVAVIQVSFLAVFVCSH